MLQSKRTRDKAFDVTVPKQFPNSEQEQPEPEQFFRSDESGRIARARQWLRQARGESLTANLQSQDKGR